MYYIEFMKYLYDHNLALFKVLLNEKHSSAFFSPSITSLTYFPIQIENLKPSCHLLYTSRAWTGYKYILILRVEINIKHFIFTHSIKASGLPFIKIMNTC